MAGARRKGLGRGLDALLSSGAGASASFERPASGELRELPIDLVERGRYQPRTHMDEEALAELAASIRAHGVVQPITVRPAAQGRYEIIAGERRWRAAQLAGLHTVPAIVRDVPDEAALPIGIIENVQREDLNPVEEAGALRRLVDEFGLTHQAVADAIGRSRSAVSNLLRVLDLEPSVLAMVDRGDLELGSARALLALDPVRQREAAKLVVGRGLSARATETLVRRMQREASRSPETDKAARADPDVRRLEEELGERFGAPVRVRHDARGRGQLRIEYTSLEQLDGILARLRGDAPADLA